MSLQKNQDTAQAPIAGKTGDAGFSSHFHGKQTKVVTMKTSRHWIVRLSTFLQTMAIAAVAVSMTGCGATGKNYENENDRLRKENLQLKESMEQLKKNVDAQIAQLEAVETMMAATRPAVAGIKATDLPMAVSIEFGRYSGLVDLNGDGQDDVIRLYVKVLDQHRRFIPIAGQAQVQVLAIEPGKTPVVVKEASWDAPGLNSAYRSGLTGTYYSFEVPLPATMDPSIKELTIKAALTDAASGAVLMCEQVMKLHGRK